MLAYLWGEHFIQVWTNKHLELVLHALIKKNLGEHVAMIMQSETAKNIFAALNPETREMYIYHTLLEMKKHEAHEVAVQKVFTEAPY